MRGMKTALFIAIVAMIATGSARAQSTTGTISGRVVDSQNLPVPGVTVIATSPALQGARESVTIEKICLRTCSRGANRPITLS